MTDTCPHCHAAVETIEHRLWDCPCWAQERAPITAMGFQRDQSSRVFQHAGIVLESDGMTIELAARFMLS